MVQVASLGLGKNGLAVEGNKEVVDYFEVSVEVVVISIIAILLAVLSCAGYFICHCCPYLLPAKVRNIRAHLYRGRDKPKKFLPRQQFSDEQELFSVNYSSKAAKAGFRHKPIPNIVISTVNEQLAPNSEGEFTEIPLEEGKPEEIT